MCEVEIVEGFVAGAIGRVAEMHGAYYHEHWGFEPFFEAKVATELARFVLRYRSGQDGMWLALRAGRVEGSVIIDAEGAHGEEVAHLRWFILSDALRGTGVGHRLVRAAVDFCAARGYRHVYLWTFEGLGAARHLYEKSGFTLAEQRSGDQWGTPVNEQRFVLELAATMD